MKVMIIGGGVAGLSAYVGLARAGIDSKIYERSPARDQMGHGFILLGNGIDSLNQMGFEKDLNRYGQPIESFILKTHQGEFIGEAELKNSMGFKRSQFIELLANRIPADALQMGHAFTEFIWNAEGDCIGAKFENGQVVQADLYIGADGVHSHVRSALFSNPKISDGRVKELVCHAADAEIAHELGHSLVKFQDPEGGLALGILPTGGDQLVWYLQFDSRKFDLQGTDARSKKEFVEKRVGNWTAPLPRLIQFTDFNTAHVWNTKEMEPLNRFYYKNIVLIGDAAHTFLPFTSQGVNSALQDIQVLALELRNVVEGRISLEEALESFNQSQRPIAVKFYKSGRELSSQFVKPIDLKSPLTVPLCK
jgi:2-polyprenyl-6-methoxyphenol hydroxylase-like FAD-dependent oxidoreductase